MNYWLFKSEPDVFSFDDLKARPGQREPWTGVRNYQARNFMRDGMEMGDLAFFYHSSCPEPGIAGVMKVASAAYPDPTQFDPADEYHDPKATAEKPIWMLVDVKWHAALPKFISLDALRAEPALEGLRLLQRGTRLSIIPVDEPHFRKICSMGGLKLK